MGYVGSNSVSAQGICVVGNSRRVLYNVNVYLIRFYDELNICTKEGQCLVQTDFLS